MKNADADKTTNCIGLQSKHSKQMAHQRNCKSAKANQRSLSDYGSFLNRTKDFFCFPYVKVFSINCTVKLMAQNKTKQTS